VGPQQDGVLEFAGVAFSEGALKEFKSNLTESKIRQTIFRPDQDV